MHVVLYRGAMLSNVCENRLLSKKQDLVQAGPNSHNLQHSKTFNKYLRRRLTSYPNLKSISTNLNALAIKLS